MNKTLYNALRDTGLAVFDFLYDSVSYWSLLNTCKQFILLCKVTVGPKHKPWITCEIKRVAMQVWNTYKHLTLKPQAHALPITLRIEHLYQLYNRLFIILLSTPLKATFTNILIIFAPNVTPRKLTLKNGGVSVNLFWAVNYVLLFFFVYIN